jgi:nicotinamide riboside transporter PnuC
VWLTVKQNPWCWPIGLVMVLLYSWIFYDVKLYSDMLLQVIYAALQVYGWWQWTRAVKSSMDARSRLGGRPSLPPDGRRGGSLLLGAAMAHWTDAAQPWLDAFLTGFSLVAQCGWRRNACNAGRCGLPGCDFRRSVPLQRPVPHRRALWVVHRDRRARLA